MGEAKPFQRLIQLNRFGCTDPAEGDRAERTQVTEDWPEHSPHTDYPGNKFTICSH